MPPRSTRDRIAKRPPRHRRSRTRDASSAPRFPRRRARRRLRLRSRRRLRAPSRARRTGRTPRRYSGRYAGSPRRVVRLRDVRTRVQSGDETRRRRPSAERPRRREMPLVRHRGARARFARAVASTIENESPTERAFGDDAKENRARTTRAAFVLSKETTRPPRASWRGSPDTSRRCRWMPNTARARVASRRRGISDSARWLSAASTWPPPPPPPRAPRGSRARKRDKALPRAPRSRRSRDARAPSPAARNRAVRSRPAPTRCRRRRARHRRTRRMRTRRQDGCARRRCVRSPPRARPESADDERIRRTDAEGSGAVECARCRAAHCEAFAGGDGAACAVCDQPFRPVKVPGVV